jgi:hypothetical protein
MTQVTAAAYPGSQMNFLKDWKIYFRQLVIIQKKKVRRYEEDIAKCRLLIMDGNMELPTMEYILDVCRSARVPGKKQFTLSSFL